MRSVSQQGRARRHTPALVTAVLVGSVLAACTSESPPSSTDPTKGASLAQCQPYGLSSAPVALKLPGMFLYAAVPDATASANLPSEALIAFDEKQPDGSVSASATLFVAAASSAPDRIRETIWKANIGEHGQWSVDTVTKGAITLSGAADTTQAAKVSHSTFTTHRGTTSAAFDYWAFTASGQRYLLSYARTPTARTPDAATFFATATSCPRSNQRG
jgi:hypothetical protein